MDVCRAQAGHHYHPTIHQVVLIFYLCTPFKHTFQGFSCHDFTLGECTSTDEELRLVLDTMGAHSFNFVLIDLEQDEHFIEVQARIYQHPYAEVGSAVATATIGMGSLTVDEVKFVKGYNP